MRVGVDIDGVLANFNKAYIDLIVQYMGRDLFPERPFDIPCWNYPQHYGYTEAETKECFDQVRRDPTFWLNLEPYPDTSRFLDRLDIRIDPEYLYFITDRPGIDTKWQSEEWLKGFDLDTPTVLVSPDKGLLARALRLDYYIDDKNENLQSVVKESPNTKVYRLSRPWNEHIEGTNTVDKLSEFADVLLAQWRIENGTKVSVR